MDDSLDLLGLTFSDLEEAANRLLPGGRGVANRIYKAAFAEGRLATEGLGLSPSSVLAWESAFRVGLLEPGLVREEAGEFGSTSKATLVLADGAEIECVRLPMPPRPDGRSRATLCISCQVGCLRACAFCETGRSGLVRNLTAAEIVSQLVTARLRLGWDFGNVVFMGMGEPVDNLEAVAKALAVMTDGRGLGLSWERITVCSSGSVEGIEGLRRLGHSRLNLSLSLNAAEDGLRSRLMPSNRDSGLEALAAALRAYPQRRNFVLGLNYCLLPGINDSRSDAALVAAFSRSVGPSLVNLIPYNPGSSPLAPRPTEEEAERFAAWLREEGCRVRRRATKGGSIMAACGQLGGRVGLGREG